MLFDAQQFSERLSVPASWDEHVFRYCTFSNIADDGSHVDSIFCSSSFVQCDWYWGLFNLAVFVDVAFEKCTFRGCSFAGCKFVECRFIDCEFVADNLGRDCSFDETAWYSCQQHNCTGLQDAFAN